MLGKFLASFVFICIMIGLTAIYPILLIVFGNPEVWVMVSGYIGLLLMATAFVAVGLFTSSVTENQIIAAVSGLVAMLLLYLIGWPAQARGGRAWADSQIPVRHRSLCRAGQGRH